MDSKEMGSLGGRARAEKLSPERRHQIALQAGMANARRILRRKKAEAAKKKRASDTQLVD